MPSMKKSYMLPEVKNVSKNKVSQVYPQARTKYPESTNHNMVQGGDRVVVKSIAEQLGLEGSYVPHTCIEQIQLEKQALPDDLKTEPSINEDLFSSRPKEALSRGLADWVAMRHKHLKSGMPHSDSAQGDKNLSEVTRLAVGGRRFDGRNQDSPAMPASQGVVIQLSEQMSTLNERMDEFTSRMEELNSKLTMKRVSSSQQNLSVPAEACNGSAPTSLFGSGFRNGSTGSLLTISLSSSQFAKESPFMVERRGLFASYVRVRKFWILMKNIVFMWQVKIAWKKTAERREKSSLLAFMEVVGARLAVYASVDNGGLHPLLTQCCVVLIFRLASLVRTTGSLRRLHLDVTGLQHFHL